MKKMKIYPYNYDITLSWDTVQVFDGHPITGSREYERAYYYRFNSFPTTRYIILARMAEKRWELCRTERFEYGGYRYTWCRKKEN
jgi:hypothetical protein